MRGMSVDEVERLTNEWLGQVQAVCPEQLLGACRFAPPRNEVGGRAAALGGSLGGGLLGRMLVRKTEAAVNGNRAGGLPQSFILAVTPTNVRVYETSISRGGEQIGAEVTAWDRARLEVLDVSRGGMKTTVSLRLPDGQELACSAGTHDYTDRFLALLTSAPAG
jgi:hypothetical protein